MNAWDQIKHHLQNTLSRDAFGNWVHRTDLVTEKGDVLQVSVPDAATKELMEMDYCHAVRAAIRTLDLPYSHVEYRLPVGAAAVPQARNNGFAYTDSSPAYSDSFAGTAVQLNNRLTFESFVVGPCNQFAHAAAQAVAKIPSRSYNPLFIYGGVGMGKTHLMHAIGRSLIDNHHGMRIVYTTSERFINLMIQSIKTDTMSRFHQHFRSADVLLVDDIQFLAGKERTQDEFFYTFNELYDHQKQIVISSDSPPKQIANLVERLRSRFEWGLMVDVQPPDLETKMAILDKKAEQEGIELPEEVRVFIARHTKSNLRELEGALVKLIAYSSMSGSPITMNMAETTLRYMTVGTDRKVTIDAIIRAVADKMGLQPSQLKQKTNAWNISYPRQIAMYIAKELTRASLPEIGKAFGGKHHTTVLHSIEKIEDKRHTDPDLQKIINSIVDSLQ
ncbi:MAG: chromosomal replication initiator protein DnaA [Bryobacteraceae bacterium]|nr:chromosomal replication initiator protein DnaA [Bryobacteraceae bacterium]